MQDHRSMGDIAVGPARASACETYRPDRPPADDDLLQASFEPGSSQVLMDAAGKMAAAPMLEGARR